MSIHYRLIGITGLAGTGKDTLREYLESDHGFTGLSFADPIRQMIHALLVENGIDTSYMHLRALKEVEIPGLGVSYRQMAQTLGTEWGRNCMGPEFWTRIAAHQLAGQRQIGERLFVFSDVRFLNEANFIKENGGELWRITRAAATPVRAHVSESEQALIQADRVICNDGTVEDLWCIVSSLIEGTGK